MALGSHAMISDEMCTTAKAFLRTGSSLCDKQGKYANQGNARQVCKSSTEGVFAWALMNFEVSTELNKHGRIAKRVSSRC